MGDYNSNHPATMIKKAGPPVPPRPSAVLVANALAKSRAGNSSTTTVVTPGTTVTTSPSDHHYNNNPQQKQSTLNAGGGSLHNSIVVTSRNKILISNNSTASNSPSTGNSGTWQKTTAQGGVSVSTTVSAVEDMGLKPLQIETYTKSPSMIRAKRMVDYNHGQPQNTSARNAEDDSGDLWLHSRRPPPVAAARLTTAKAAAQDLMMSTRPKNTCNNNNNNFSGNQKSSSLENDAMRLLQDKKTVVVTSGGNESKPKNSFVATSSTFAGQNNHHHNANNGLNGAADEDHNNALGCRQAEPSPQTLVRVLGNGSNVAISNQSNYVNECTIGQSQSPANVQSQLAAGNDHHTNSNNKWTDNNKTRSDAILATTISTDTVALVSHSTRNYPEDVVLMTGSINDGDKVSRNSPYNRSTTAIELKTDNIESNDYCDDDNHNAFATDNHSGSNAVNGSSALPTVVHDNCRSDVIVVGGTTETASENHSVLQLLPPPPQRTTTRDQNRNRIEIKATEPGRYELGNWQRPKMQNHLSSISSSSSSSRTTLLIRSGSSASSDSSLSTTSSASLSSSSFSKGHEEQASSKSMAHHQLQQKQQRTEIIINHHHSPSIDHHHVQYPTNGGSLAGVVRPEPEGGESTSVGSANEQHHRTDVKKSTPVGGGALIKTAAVQLDRLPRERKVAFHEKLISELAAMHHRGQSPQPQEEEVAKRRATNARGDTAEITAEDEEQQHLKRHSISSPDGSSVSPNGSRRSRIRTADWIEVGDNGKQMLFSSCQISLEDSGLEDEMERLEETSSSGAGDSWDSVIDHDERYLLISCFMIRYCLLPVVVMIGERDCDGRWGDIWKRRSLSREEF